MDEKEYNDFLKKSYKNVSRLKANNDVACYYCLKVYNFSKIKDFCDRGETAICPYCGVDAVVEYSIEHHERDLANLKYVNERAFKRNKK